MKWFKIGLAGALVVAALLVIFGIPANFLVGAIKSRIEAQTGYRLRTEGETTINFWPKPSISLRDITVFAGGDSAAENRFRADRLLAELSLADLWHGHARVTALTIVRPTLRVPLPRERLASAPAMAASANTTNSNGDSPTIDHVAVEEGIVVFYGRSGRDEGHIDHVNLEASLTAAAGTVATGSLYFGSQVVHVSLKSQALPQRLEGHTIPIELTLQAPGLFEQALSAHAELRSRNSMLSVNTLSGRSGQVNFDGWATVDFGASKPMVKADLDFNRLQFLPPGPNHAGASNQTALSEPWSDHQYNFDVLNFFDAQMRVSAADFAVASFHLAPVTVDATVNAGVLQAKFVNTALYGGAADGTIFLDASSAAPTQALNLRLGGVNALPLLTDVAGFDSLEGGMQAVIDVHATGNSEQAAMSSLAGTVDFHLTNGALRGIDLAKIMHDLTNTILNGWQWNAADRTPLSDFSAHFTLVNGVASTDNLTLMGPVVQMTGTGTIDISAKTLQMKVDPRLLVGQQATAGSAGSGQGAGLGVPVMVRGSWSAPRIFPDVAGILNDPSAIFNQLQSAGKGLFGAMGQPGNNSSGNPDSGGNGNTFDNLLGSFGNMLKGSGGNGGAFSGNSR
jgi:AsmA protein